MIVEPLRATCSTFFMQNKTPRTFALGFVFVGVL